MSISDRLGLGSNLAGRLKSVGEFLSGAIEPIAKLGRSELVEGISGVGWAGMVTKGLERAAPWAEFAGSVAPPLKLLSMVIEHVANEPDPEVLAYLAWSTAYQRAVEQAVILLAYRMVGEGDPDQLEAQVKWAVEQMKRPEEPTIVHPSLKDVLNQPFVRQADELLDAYARVAGFGEEDRRALRVGVHERFRWNLNLTLSHGDLREKFAPLVELLELGGGDDLRARHTLRRHADYQRSLFEDARVLRHEPFSLKHVHVPNDCGVLTWGQCRDGMPDPGDPKRSCRPDPFVEKFGGRRPLLDAVLEFMKDPSFKDVIVVQGVAGSGKSTFTLHLCAELIRMELIPIRVRLRDIDLHKHAKDAIPAQVLFEDDDGEERRPADPDSLFCNLERFDETSVFFGDAKISPYVLILDGWDELETIGDQKKRDRIPQFIDEVRRYFIKDRRNRVRVVLTGRPWSEVTRSDAGFLDAKTPILTIRPWSPEQLGCFFTRVAHFVEMAPLGWPDETLKWTAVGSDVLARVKEKYEESRRNTGSMTGATLEILGSPLLAHLTVRLLSQGDDDVDALMSDTTQLYRRLVDQTCYDGGRASAVAGEVKRAPAFGGARLRTLLHVTAMAMTIEDRERISYDVLEQRIRDLHALHPFEDRELSRLVDDASRDFPVADLLIAFFFKGGREDLGCEFAHKSFREYLFAEAVVEVLKSIAGELPPRVRARPQWWADFSDDDPRFRIIRKLGPALAAQWMMPDVVGHLESLLRWEVGRTGESESRAGHEVITPALSVEEWSRIRDLLADLWKWWAEGVHLRSPVKKGTGGNLDHGLPYAVELARWVYPADWRTQKPLPAPVRSVAVDAHLGDALFRLCVWVHAFVAQGREVHVEPRSWKVFESENDYQSKRRADGDVWVRFKPGGKQREYLSNLIGRINAAGGRPDGIFPMGANLMGANLMGANLMNANLIRADLVGANLIRAGLVGANLFRANLVSANLSGASLVSANLSGAGLMGANLFRANLRDTNLSGANLSGANLSGANLSGANLRGTNLRGTNLSGATGVTVEMLSDCHSIDGAGLDEDLYERFSRQKANDKLSKPTPS